MQVAKDAFLWGSCDCADSLRFDLTVLGGENNINVANCVDEAGNSISVLLYR